MFKGITELEISNFKSIKQINMPCKRINVLIGRPNVGKSNILEALSLFVAPYDNSEVFLKNYIRYEKLSNLFYDQDRKNPILVTTDIGFATMRYHMNNINAYDLLIAPDVGVLSLYYGSNNKNESLYDFSQWVDEYVRNYRSAGVNNKMSASHVYGVFSDGQKFQELPDHGSSVGYNTSLKSYRYKSLQQYINHFPAFLHPPHGDNLFTILESFPDLYDDCAAFFNDYGLNLVLNIQREEVLVQKKIGRKVYDTPYFLSADTLQRVIFHLLAIQTNKNSILLFEEPESHSFPPYIKQVAEAIIESEDNQFFIATHSPYILTTLLEQCSFDDLSVCYVDYNNFETTVKTLPVADMQEILDSHADIFFNFRLFDQ